MLLVVTFDFSRTNNGDYDIVLAWSTGGCCSELRSPDASKTCSYGLSNGGAVMQPNLSLYTVHNIVLGLKASRLARL